MSVKYQTLSIDLVSRTTAFPFFPMLMKCHEPVLVFQSKREPSWKNVSAHQLETHRGLQRHKQLKQNQKFHLCQQRAALPSTPPIFTCIHIKICNLIYLSAAASDKPSAPTLPLTYMYCTSLTPPSITATHVHLYIITYCIYHKCSSALHVHIKHIWLLESAPADRIKIYVTIRLWEQLLVRRRLEALALINTAHLNWVTLWNGATSFPHPRKMKEVITSVVLLRWILSLCFKELGVPTRVRSEEIKPVGSLKWRKTGLEINLKHKKQKNIFSYFSHWGQTLQTRGAENKPQRSSSCK